MRQFPLLAALILALSLSARPAHANLCIKILGFELSVGIDGVQIGFGSIQKDKTRARRELPYLNVSYADWEKAYLNGADNYDQAVDVAKIAANKGADWVDRYVELRDISEHQEALLVMGFDDEARDFYVDTRDHLEHAEAYEALEKVQPKNRETFLEILDLVDADEAIVAIVEFQAGRINVDDYIELLDSYDHAKALRLARRSSE